MELEFVMSNKGREMLVVDGCPFRLEKTIKEKKIWKCTEYRTAKCKSRCHSKDGILTKQPNQHNHVPDKAKLVSKKVMAEIKQKATVCNDT